MRRFTRLRTSVETPRREVDHTLLSSASDTGRMLSTLPGTVGMLSILSRWHADCAGSVRMDIDVSSMEVDLGAIGGIERGSARF